MIRQDYLLREIERIVEFAIKALRLRDEEPPAEFLNFLQEHCENLTGLRYDVLLATPSAGLVSLFHDPEGRHISRLVACGTLLAEAAEARRLEGAVEEARTLFVRAVEILAFTASQFPGEPSALLAAHLLRLRERIAHHHFPPELHQRLELLCTPATETTD